MRISQVASAVGTTTRTIRYYEEIGLLPAAAGRERGSHRTYTEADVERLRDALQLKALLGVSLEELKALVEAEDARAALRDELRIGDVARRVGTTPRTIRYYEEIGLLPAAPGRERGSHRVYSESDVERLREVMQLKELLGVSLEELKTLVEAEDARAALRAEWNAGDADEDRRRAILDEALGHLERQLELLRSRRAAIEELEAELVARRRRVHKRLRELG